MKIKVCGMRQADNVRCVAALGIDLMGFIFYPRSSRYVLCDDAEGTITPEELRSQPQEGPERVGVFVDAQTDDILRAVADYGLHYVQLHGHEAPEYCTRLRSGLGTGVKIIKALSVAGVNDVVHHSAYDTVADLLLFDTKCTTMGGSGRQFDWTMLDAYTGPLPFLLSGGIGPDDADRVLDFRHPRCIGIDLNSKFETAPALKDVEALKKFISTIKKKQRDNE